MKLRRMEAKRFVRAYGNTLLIPFLTVRKTHGNIQEKTLISTELKL